MAVVTLRPNGTASGSGNVTVTVAASAHAATNDNLDTTFFRKNNSINGQASVTLNFGTTSVTSSQKVRQVRVRARVQNPSNSSKLFIQLGSGSYFLPALAVRGSLATGEVVGSWYSTSPTGSYWRQALIDDVRVKVTDYKDGTDRAYVYELYVDVDVANQSTVSVSAPTGTVTTTAAPTVEWSVTDSDGDAATHYQVKVFTSAQYSAAGFDPSVSAATYDSGQVESADTALTIGTYLLNATHRAYVRSAKTINGQPFWSAWAYSQFTISLSPPSAPTLTTSYNATQNSVALTATGAAPTGFDSQTFEIQRSDDSGDTWTTVRYADALVPNVSHVASVTDQEPKRATVVQYRGRAVGVVGGNVQVSAWGAVVNVTTTNNGTWIVKTLSRTPIVASGVRVVGNNGFDIKEQVGTFYPLGRTYPVVLSQALHGRDGDLRIVTIGQGEYDALYGLITYRGKLLVQDPFGGQQYIRITDRQVERSGAASNPKHSIQLNYLEVEG